MAAPWTPQDAFDQAYIEADYIEDYFEGDDQVEQSPSANTWTSENPPA